MSVDGLPVASNPLRTVRFWIAPVGLVSVVMGLLCVMYLGGIVNPEDELRGFPIALVNEDNGGAVPSGDGFSHIDVGSQVSEGLAANIPGDRIELEEMTWDDAAGKMSDGRLYGAIVIPPNFSGDTARLAVDALTDGAVAKPEMTVYTNPRAGTVSRAITETVADQASAQINEAMGRQVTSLVKERGEVSAVAEALLAEPVDAHIEEYNPLPDNSGLGLSAFYYALLLTLAGFTGASVIHTVVDGELGILPVEVGPVFRQRSPVHLNRVRTLYVKWGLVTIMSLVVASVFVAIMHLLGMPVTNTPLLVEYSAIVIAAVGICSISTMAVFGNLGILLNLIVFVVLGLSASGGTVPMEAVPGPLRAVGEFVPLRQIYLGTRALLYFDGRYQAGLLSATVWAGVGLAVGLLAGLVGTRLYDRFGFERAPEGSAHREVSAESLRGGPIGSVAGDRVGEQEKQGVRT